MRASENVTASDNPRFLNLLIAEPLQCLLTMTTSMRGFQLALPQPYFTRYHVQESNVPASDPAFQILLDKENTSSNLPTQLHNENLYFSELRNGDEVPANNNTQWARARRSPVLTFQWTTSESPNLAQIWLIVYAIFSFHTETEQFRLSLEGPEFVKIQQDLISVGLAIQSQAGEDPNTTALIIIRSAFWQGAGSPFGPRPLWLADSNILNSTSQSLANYPPQPLTYTLTNRFPTTPIYARHPVRPVKPTPGSTIYSRYIPHLKEHFSMVALDYKNDEHLQLFHKWQNDPRVAQGWNETGTVDQHREYLRKLHEDPHVLTVLAKFEDIFFAYFEIYWAKVYPTHHLHQHKLIQ